MKLMKIFLIVLVFMSSPFFVLSEHVHFIMESLCECYFTDRSVRNSCACVCVPLGLLMLDYHGFLIVPLLFDALHLVSTRSGTMSSVVFGLPSSEVSGLLYQTHTHHKTDNRQQTSEHKAQSFSSVYASLSPDQTHDADHQCSFGGVDSHN